MITVKILIFENFANSLSYEQNYVYSYTFTLQYTLYLKLTSLSLRISNDERKGDFTNFEPKLTIFVITHNHLDHGTWTISMIKLEVVYLQLENFCSTLYHT